MNAFALALLALLFAFPAWSKTCFYDSAGVFTCLEDVTTNAPTTTQFEGTKFTMTGTAANGKALTITLPASSWNVLCRHYITRIHISKYVTTSTFTGSATPIRMTTTNMNGFSQLFATTGTLGSSESFDPPYISLASPFKTAAVNTATTLVLPAVTTTCLWDASVDCYDAP